MENQSQPMLLALCQKQLTLAVREDVLATCPTMDLVAVASKDEQLDVYRFNGQRAFGLKRHGDDKIDSFAWKFNGHYIAVGWHDGSVDVVSADNGETLKHFKQVTDSDKKERSTSNQGISCIGWGVNFIDANSIRTRLQRRRKGGELLYSNDATNGLEFTKEDISLDDFLDRQPELAKIGANTSLPDQLALVDVQSILPKLPVLPPITAAPGARPVVKGPSDIFASQISLDAVIHNVYTKDPNAVDVLIVCGEDGSVKPVLYDSLALGSLKAPVSWGLTKFRPVLHSTHPFSCSHLLLVEAISGSSAQRLILVPFTLKFVRSSGINLHLVASRTAQLQNLLQYLDGCILSLGHYWNHSQDLPSRFMRNVNETLEEKHEGVLVDNLYHLAVTGHCPATLKEWLVDELAERGHKRWDQAANHGLSKILELTHENLLPAIDRCSIVLGRLRGLSIYHDGLFDISPQKITTILVLMQSLQLVGHGILSFAREERQQFATFSKWLRHEIDVQATDPTSTSAEETADKDLGLDHGLLLRYIQGALTQSKLKSLLAPTPNTDSFGSQTPSSIEETAKALERHKTQAEGSDMISIWNLLEQVKYQCSVLSSQITSWQTTNIAMDCGLILEEDEITAKDMRMSYEESSVSADSMTTHIALVPKTASHQLRLHRIKHSESFISVRDCVHASDRLNLSFGKAQVKDVKFADDASLLVLLRLEDAAYIVDIPYNGQKFAPLYKARADGGANEPHAVERLQFPEGHAGSNQDMVNLSISELRSYAKHVFPAEERFNPVKLAVNGRKGRRMVCVVSEGGRGYKIFDMDSGGHSSSAMDTSE